MATLEEIYGKKTKATAKTPVVSSSITPENTTLDDIYGTKKKTKVSVKQAVAELPEKKGYQATMNKISGKIGAFEGEVAGGLIAGSGHSLDMLNNLGKNLFLGFGGAKKQIKDAQNLDQANQNYQNIIFGKLKESKANKNEKETKRLMRIVEQMTKNTPQNYDTLTRPESIKSPFDQAIPATQEFAAKMDKIADEAGLSEFSKALGKGLGQFTSDSPALLMGGAAVGATGIPKIASRIFLNPKVFPTVGKYISPYIANSLTNIGAFGALSATHGGELSTVVRDSMLFAVFPSILKPGFFNKAAVISGDALLMGGVAKLDGASDQDAAVAAILGGIMGASGALGERSVGSTRHGVDKLKGIASDKINELSDTKIKSTSVREEIQQAFDQAKTKAKTEPERVAIETAKEILTNEHPIIKEAQKEQTREIEELASNFRPKMEPEKITEPKAEIKAEPEKITQPVKEEIVQPKTPEEIEQTRYESRPEKLTIKEFKGDEYKGIHPDNIVHFNQGANERVTLIVPAAEKKLIEYGARMRNMKTGSAAHAARVSARLQLENFAKRNGMTVEQAQTQALELHDKYKALAKANATKNSPVILNFVQKPKQKPQTKPIKKDDGAVAKKATELTKKNGGVTITLKGDIPTEGFAFSPRKDLETVIPVKEFSTKSVSDFIEKNKDILQEPESHLGVWVDNGKVYIDVSKVVPNEQRAVAEASTADQIGIFDINTFTTKNIKDYEKIDSTYTYKGKEPGADRPGSDAARPAETGGGKKLRDIGPDGRIKFTKEETTRIDETRKRAQEMPETHKIDTPERTALRNKLAEEAYGTGATNKNRRADIVIGLPASGKSSAIVKPLLKEHKGLLVDSDIVKERLPEFENGVGAGATHKESSNIADEVLARATLAGDNIVHPLLGKNTERIQKTIDDLASQGYEVYLHFNELPVEKAMDRTSTRFLDEGRFVDPKYVEEVGLRPSQTYDTLKGYEKVSGYSKISNDVARGESPVVIEQSGRLPGRGVREETRGSEGTPPRGRESDSQLTKEKSSAVYERLKEEHPELTDDFSYEAMNMKRNAEKAVELLASDKELAYRVAMGAETLPDVTNTAVNIAIAEKALLEGNFSLYNQLVKTRSFDQTRRGQEIVSEKGSITDNSTARYFKELLNLRMEKLGDQYLSDVRSIFKKTSKKKRALEVIDKEVEKAQKKMKNKEIDLVEAQKLIDALMCK